MRSVEDQIQSGIQLSPALEEIEFSLRDAQGCVTSRPISNESGVVLPAGSFLGDRELLAAASARAARVGAHPKPRVVSLTVGDDLVDISSAVDSDVAPDAVNVMLTATIRNSGAHGFRAGPIRENAEALANALHDQLVRSDLVMIVFDLAVDAQTGSPSNAVTSLVLEVLQETGCAPIEFAQVDPGPAVGLTQLAGSATPVLLLHRDPDSAFVGYEVFARPMILAMAGHANRFRPVVRAQLASPAAAPAGVRRFAFGQIGLDRQTKTPQVRIIDSPREVAASWMCTANALVIVPEGVTQLAAGDEVAAIRLDRE